MEFNAKAFEIQQAAPTAKYGRSRPGQLSLGLDF
jgi:hypothetical protein